MCLFVRLCDKCIVTFSVLVISYKKSHLGRIEYKRKCHIKSHCSPKELNIGNWDHQKTTWEYFNFFQIIKNNYFSQTWTINLWNSSQILNPLARAMQLIFHAIGTGSIRGAICKLKSIENCPWFSLECFFFWMMTSSSLSSQVVFGSDGSGMMVRASGCEDHHVSLLTLLNVQVLQQPV